MSFEETAALGAIAGFTIFLGLPVGRLQMLGTRARVGLAMFAVGVLAFLFVDVFEHAFAIVEESVVGFKDDKNSVLEPIGLACCWAAASRWGRSAWRWSSGACACPAGPAAGGRQRRGAGARRPAAARRP